ncbi:MAG: argininosuccinate lyase, partial [Acidobacteriota bacterium]|nr:argininosuccinate lyase [Acidobacteriota bacterium]
AKNISNKELNEFTNSFRFDRRLFFADIRISFVYCDALFQAGVLTRLESERIKNGLQAIVKRAEFDKNYFEETAADNVHSFVETRLIQLIGEAGGKLNVGRSRDEQTATALRLWLRGEIEEISKYARDLQAALIDAGERQNEAVLPAYANQQKAQPILWAHWCLAYFEMLARDRERLDEVWRRVNVLPLGAGVLAGTSFEIDREEVARELGFEGVAANSLDAVADADFAIEMVSSCCLLMIHLSRLAEDLILYNSAEFDFIELTDSSSTDSSSTDSLLKPNTNLEILELLRGKTSRVFGHQTALLSMMKSLPLGVHKDLQEIQETVFDTVDTVNLCLKIAQINLGNIRLNEAKTKDAAAKPYFNAPELTDYLVQREIPFKFAQETVGRIVLYAISKNKKLDELSLEEMREFSEIIDEDVFHALSLEQTLASKNQIGGTAPERVFEALESAKESLEMEEN